MVAAFVASTGRRRERRVDSIDEALRKVASNHPEKPAVRHLDLVVTYSELAERAGSLATSLRQAGVLENDVVAILTDRTPAWIVAVFGVLEAGATCLPLDCDHPDDWLAVVADDAAPRALVIDGANQRRLEAATVMRIQPDGRLAGSRQGRHEPPPVVDLGARAAYITYTSGSTGRPKGVVTAHAPLVNFALSRIEAYGVETGDRVLQLASPCYDAALGDLLTALLSGAELVIRPQEMVASVEHFLATCNELSITVAEIPTSLWHELVAHLRDHPKSLPRSWRCIIVAGEQVDGNRLREWRQTVGDRVRLVNEYGPTEAAVSCTRQELDREEARSAINRRVAIGHPFPNARAYVLDSSLRPVPEGTTGDLWLGGEVLALGYLRRPAMTAERFRPDPFRTVAGARMYDTGDLVCRRNTDALEFLGRRDLQVKVRGHRIEIEQIENALRAHPEVSDAAVTLLSDPAESPRLVAALVAKGGVAPCSEAELRRRLYRELPLHMVPSAFCWIEALPQSSSGKVDRSALLRMRWTPSAAEGEEQRFEKPGGQADKVRTVLSTLWARVLGSSPTSREEDFFSVGGHSMQAVRLVALIEDELGARVPLRAVFDDPTLDGLVAAVEEVNRRRRGAGP